MTVPSNTLKKIASSEGVKAIYRDQKLKVLALPEEETHSTVQSSSPGR